MSQEPLIDRPLLERLERLTLHWQRSYQGLVGGHRASGYPGGGQEFLDHRNFTFGDDFRAVNWRAYMRLDKLFLKMFRLEPHIPVRILLDVSASMATGDRGKERFARKLTAALCYVGLVKLETVSIEPFAERLGDRFIASGGRHRFAPVSRFLTELPTQGHTDFFQVVRQFCGRHTHPGLLLIVSDFMDHRGVREPLSHLGFFGHELMLVQVWDEQDRQPPWLGDLDLVDAESGEMLALEIDEEARDAYTRAFEEHSDRLKEVAMRHGGRWIGLPTSLALEDAIFGPLSQARGVR